MENKNKGLSSTLKVLIVAGLCIIAIYATYTFTTNKEDNKYINSLYKYKQKIDSSNKSIVDALSNIDSLDTKDQKQINDIKQKTSASLSDIQNALSDIKSLSAPARYIKQFDLYIKGIEANKNLINQISLILSNSNSSDVNNAINATNNYMDECKKYYEASRLKKASISLPDGIYSIPDKLNKYAFKVLNEYQSKSVLLEQYTTYFDNMDSITSEFRGVKISLDKNYLMLLNNQTSFDKVYVAIEKKLIEINGIQDIYNNISIPSKLISNHKKFDGILNAYTTYCMNFKEAITKFEESTSNENSDEIKTIFESLEKNYNSLDKNFSDYANTYNGSKEFYTDIKNL